MAGWVSKVSERIKALLADTLFKRLFALMWLALVISHAVAFLVVTRSLPDGGVGRMPTFPSLPPVAFGQRANPASAPAIARPEGQGMPGARQGDGGPPGWNGGPGGMRGPGGGPGWPPPFSDPPGASPDGRMPPSPQPHGDPGNASQGMGLPTSMVILDYGIRLLIIGLAAWLGARWLSAPMRRLQAASRTLGQSLARNESPPHVDERAGTVEVREAAHVFNEMSRQLSDQVSSRALLVAAISHDLRTPLTRIRMRL